jgi:hypothetical protein
LLHGIPEDLGLNYVVAMDQNVAHSDNLPPFDIRIFVSEFRRLTVGRLAHNLQRTLDSQAKNVVAGQILRPATQSRVLCATRVIPNLKQSNPMVMSAHRW